MRWYKRSLWKTGIAVTSMLLLLVFLASVPVSTANASEGNPTLATSGTVIVQATPTVDATVAALQKEQLIQQVNQQQHTWSNWFWSNAATISSSLFSTLVIVGGALFGLWRWFTDRRDAQDKELKDRQNEREKRAEERFQSAVEGLGDEKEGARIGAAILLRTFLRPGYEQFYIQVFDLVVAHLRLPGTPRPSEDSSFPVPPNTLSQALIIVFKEAFSLARSQNKRWSQPLNTTSIQPLDPTGIQSLDATGIQLDNAYLWMADLEQVWMRQASLRKANLFGANFSGANLSWANFSGANLRNANLSKAHLRGVNFSEAYLINANLSTTHLRNANLSGANLSGADPSGANIWEVNISLADLKKAKLNGAEFLKTNIEDALSLKDTDLRGVTGLTKEQLTACKTKGAIIDEAHMIKTTG
jgi:hypothetical protein